MVTAFGRDEVRAQAEQIGIEAYLTKPVNASVLYDSVMELFGAEALDDAGSTARRTSRGVRCSLACASCWWKTTR